MFILSCTNLNDYFDVFLHREWQTRRVLDTRPKPDGYGYEYKVLPVGTGTSMDFYLQPFFYRAGICSTRLVAIPTLLQPNRQRPRTRVMGLEGRAKPLSGGGGRRRVMPRTMEEAGTVQRQRRSPRSSK
jgi:hypothetical protein